MGAFNRYEIEPPPWLFRVLSRSPIWQRLYPRLGEDLARVLPNGSRVADIGTGPGHLLRYLGSRRPDLRLSGVDLAPAMFRGRRRTSSEGPTASLVAGDAQALPIKTGSLDWVVSSFSFHIWPQPQQGVREMLRVLKPQGRAWIYEMNREAGRGEIRGFARELGLPAFLVWGGFKGLSWHHSLREEDFAMTFSHVGVERWEVQPVHHVFLRAQMRKE